MSSSTTDRRQFYTYLHCRPDGTPFYVGKGHGQRCREFGRSAGRNSRHAAIVAKHGAENILVFAFPCESEQEALRDEIQQISQLRADGLELANITGGGQGVSGLVHSAETRAKLAESSRRAKNFLGHKHTSETKAKISANNKSRLPEIKEKISIACKGYRHTPEAKAKIGAASKGNKHNTGRRPSLETRAKLSAAHKGNKYRLGKPGNIGIKRTPETIAAMSAARKGKPWTAARWAAHKGEYHF